MTGYKRFTSFQQGQIKALHATGTSYTEIADQLKILKGGVQHVIQRQKRPKKPKKMGRPPKLTPRDRRHLINSASNSQKSCKKTGR
jgi:IS30 family transposase